MADNLARLRSFIPADSPLGRAGGADVLLRATGGNYAGAAALAAIARKESSFGAQAFAPNNFWGWGVHNGPSVNTAPTVEAMARRVWQGLSGGLYKGAGLTTLPAILNRYAPPSENNTALYKQQTSQWLQQLGLTPDTNIFAGGQAADLVNRPSEKQLGTTTGPVRPAVPQAGDPRQRALLAMQAIGEINQGGVQPDTLIALGRSSRQAAPPPSPAGGAAAAASTQDLGVKADPSSKQAINAAKGVLGTPYSWGGGTPSGPTKGFGRGANTVGFDCSSLVQMAWAKAGVQLPRTTYEQIKVGAAVPNLAHAQPGDLLFPSTGHVQLYLGNGRVIEAPQTGGHVQVVPVRSKYIAIRRPGA